MNPSGASLKVLAHRGLWTAKHEQNSLGAFRAAWSVAAGVETDLRDLDGQVVVSHDMPRRTGVRMTLDELLDAWVAHGRTGQLALNIKSDGIAEHVGAAVRAVDATEHAFVFDMSVPDQLTYLPTGLPTYSRWSEIEAPSQRNRIDGLWLDAFWEDDWWDVAAVRAHLHQGTPVVLVSPELHRRAHLPTWARLRREGLDTEPGLSLCTDHVHEAASFFGLATRHASEVLA